MPVPLSEDERDVLLTETAQALDQMRAPELRTRYSELLSAVDAGEVPDDLLETLQTLLEVGLESGRIRRVHLAHGEMAARRIFSRTPKGRALKAAADGVSEALTALQGHAIEEITVAPNGPGSYTLNLATSEGRLVLRFERSGVSLQSVDVG